jgi:pilus assembly protein CpaF
VVHLERMRDGTRKVVQISEITGMEDDVISMQDIFRFTRTGIDADGRVLGGFAAATIRPRILDRLISLGFEMPPEIARVFPAPIQRAQ